MQDPSRGTMTHARVVWLAAGMGLFSAGFATADEPDAAELVRKVRKQEAWIDRVDSLWLKADIMWERTPRGFAKRRRELQRELPGQNLDKHPDLQPIDPQKSEVAFDRTRVRTR